MSDSEEENIPVAVLPSPTEIDLKNYDDSSVKVKIKRKRNVRKGDDRTEAQKAATGKMLDAVRIKREELAKVNEERMKTQTEQERQRMLAVEYEKTRLRRHKLPPPPSYITFADFEVLRKDLTTLKGDILSAMPQTIYKAVPIEVPMKPKPKPSMAMSMSMPSIAEAKVVAEVKPVEKKLTGSALLNEIFFKDR